MTRTIPALALLSGAPVAPAQCVPAWSPLGEGCSHDVMALATDYGDASPRSGGTLYVAGYFENAGGVFSQRMARFNRHGWTPITTGISGSGNGVEGLEHHTLRSPTTPVEHGAYAVGLFSSAGGLQTPNAVLLRGEEWTALAGGLPQLYVFCLALFDEDGSGPVPPLMFAGGDGPPGPSLVKWNGASWAQMAEPLLPSAVTGISVSVYALDAYDDDGPGPRRPGLYVGGSFRGAGSVDGSRNIIRWDGKAWERLAFGVNSAVQSMCAFDDDGPGPRKESLFVGGQFNSASGTPASFMARWYQGQWSAVLTGASSTVRAMAVFDDDGSGPNPPALFFTGFFANSPPNRIAKWAGIGHAFQSLGSGLSGAFPEGLALAVFDEDGTGPNPGGLYVGGHFTMAGGVPANYIARWGCPLPSPCYPDCDDDGQLTLADFGCFQTKFGLGDMQADCDGDAALTLADFGCFQTAFGLGCP